MYPFLVLFQAILTFLLESMADLLLIPIQLTMGLIRRTFQRPGNPEYHAEVAEAIEVIEHLKSQASTSREVAQLEHAANLLRKSSSSGKDLPAIAKPKTLQVRDTNRFVSTNWFSQSFPDFFWALTSYSDPEWPCPPASQRKKIKERIMNSPKVKEAMKATARTNSLTEDQVKKKASKIFEEMACDMRIYIVRFVAFILRKVLRLLYPFGMNVAVEDLERVKEMARRGTIVYLPCHKSYVDFLVVSYICFSHGLPLPHVVSGENLNIPLVGPILRYGGAFFIRRTFGNDELYRTIFNEYVTSLLIAGNTIECFIEGGRSRGGKVLPPKPGFLRVIVDAVANGEVADIHLIPISIGYDRIVENDNYIKELTGGEKKAERLLAFLSSSTNLIVKAFTKAYCFGQINVGFGQPISVAKYLESAKTNNVISNEQRKQLTKNLGYQTLYEINYSNTILLTTLVGTVLLTQYGRGIRFEELTAKVKWLRREVLARGARVRQQSDEEVTANLSSVVENILESKSASNKKNRLVKRHKHILMLSLYSPAEQMELALYRNQLIHFFVSEGVVACGLYACEKDATTSPALVSRQDLFERVEFLSKLLKLEFVYKPSPAITETFDQTIAFLIRRNILDQPNDDTFCVNENVKDEESGGTFVYLFLCSLFWPFIESYWLAALGLIKLLPHKICEERQLIQFTQDIGERLYFEGMIDIYEAISQETLVNAFTLYESWEIIQFLEISGQPGSGPGKRIIHLHPNFREWEKVEAFIHKVGSYRKRVTAYRSRRYKLRRNHFVADAITYAKNCLAN